MDALAAWHGEGWIIRRSAPRAEREVDELAAFRHTSLEKSLHAGNKRIAGDLSLGGAACVVRALNRAALIPEKVLEVIGKLHEIADQPVPIEFTQLVRMTPPDALDRFGLGDIAQSREAQPHVEIVRTLELRRIIPYDLLHAGAPD